MPLFASLRSAMTSPIDTLEQHLLARRELGDELVGIFAADGARGCQQTDATIAGQGSGRLDGRHHPHHRNAQGGSQGWQGYGAGRVTGNHHQINFRQLHGGRVIGQYSDINPQLLFNLCCLR